VPDSLPGRGRAYLPASAVVLPLAGALESKSAASIFMTSSLQPGSMTYPRATPPAIRGCSEAPLRLNILHWPNIPHWAPYWLSDAVLAR